VVTELALGRRGPMIVGRLDGCGTAVTRKVLRANTATLLGLPDHAPALAG